MMKRSIGTALTLFLLSISGVADGQLAAVGKTENRFGCEPVGRVLTQGFLYVEPGSLLCKGDHLQVVNATSASLLCFSSGRFVTVKDQMDASKCGASEMGVDPCITEVKPSCFKLHELFRPYGDILMNGRPFFSWRPAKGATSYIVAVKGYNLNWEKTVKATTMPYPSEVEALRIGDAYKVTILVMQGDTPISEDSSVVNILPENEVKQIVKAVGQIKKLNLPKDEETYLDLDNLYMSRGLLNDTINALEVRVKAGSQNPALYRVLGERYLDARLLDDAEPKLRTAAQLAEADHNDIELEKARSGLEIVKRYRSSAKASGS